MASTITDRINGAQSGKAFKAPCKAATTASITLSGEQTIDGISAVSGDRVLVKNQADQTQNGIYVCDTSEWNRAPDFDGDGDVVKGTMVFVHSGSTNGGKLWSVTAADTITIDSTSITWQQRTFT